MFVLIQREDTMIIIKELMNLVEKKIRTIFPNRMIIFISNIILIHSIWITNGYQSLITVLNIK